MSANRENILKWVEALESGDYQQTTGRLTEVDKDGNQSHCCLGVATVLCIADGAELSPVEQTSGWDSLPNYVRYAEAWDNVGEAFDLPTAGYEWLGLTDPREVEVTVDLSEQVNPEYADDFRETRVNVAELNDQYRWSFTQIAQAIRAEYLKESE